MKCKMIALWIVLGLLVLTISCATIAPPKNKEVGGIAGNFHVVLDKTWKSSSKWSKGDTVWHEGKYKSNITLLFQKIDNGRTFKTYVNDGFYYLLNVPPGNYRLVAWRMNKNSEDELYSQLDKNFGIKTNIDRDVFLKNVNVSSHTISVVDSVRVNIAFPMDVCKNIICDFDYENVYTTEANKQEVMNNFQQQNEEAYEAWSMFDWVNKS